jgi:hypothetical protein
MKMEFIAYVLGLILGIAIGLTHGIAIRKTSKPKIKGGNKK